MPGYLVAQVRVQDPQRYQEYRARVPATIEKFGGRFVLRAPDVVVLEGRHDGRRLVVIEFPSVEAVQAWYASPEYQAIIPLRQSCSEGDLWVVSGV